ncbi:MAG TPA: hypothetical protein VKY92_11415 [Verrucomicrobiae bacterium]|nr:hypothetical protein [Verrucomicrobiae bacterium]
MISRRLPALLAFLGLWLALLAPPLEAAPNPLPGAPVTGSRTNLPLRPGARTNALSQAAGARRGTNAPAASAPSGSRSANLLNTLNRWRSSPVFYQVIVGAAICVALIFLVRAKVAKSRAPQATLPVTSSKLGAKARGLSGGTISSCNVLEFGPQARQLWQFDARGSGFILNREQTCLDGQPLPSHMVAKDWRSFFNRKLNIAWLPPESVFLRVIQLPRSDLNETLAMVELQLEKISPMPVAQIAWSIHVLPHIEGNLQTVVVTMVERTRVEEYLGLLEGQGYLADRLEVPLLDQLQTTAITEDGAWIYPDSAAGKNTAIVAWWYKGVLQSLDLLTMPAANRPESLKEQLLQMAWAGEMDGWLASPPEWHLVADVGAADWEPALRAGLDQPIEVLPPRPPRELAALTAKRSAQTEPRANLMPPEFAERYQQQFVDRLWMRGLLALGALYLLGVAIYMGTLGYATFRTDAVEKQVAQLGPTYTNAIQLRDRYKVLKERKELKFAGLDCWSTTARLLPENMTLESLNFSDGRRLNLAGTAPGDATKELYAFEGEMRKATTASGEPLFDPNKGESIQFRVQGATASWSLSLELKRSEVQ